MGSPSDPKLRPSRTAQFRHLNGTHDARWSCGDQRVPPASTLSFRKFPGKPEGVWCSILLPILATLSRVSLRAGLEQNLRRNRGNRQTTRVFSSYVFPGVDAVRTSVTRHSTRPPRPPRPPKSSPTRSAPNLNLSTVTYISAKYTGIYYFADLADLAFGTQTKHLSC